MPTQEICDLNVPIANNAALFLWATNAMLLDALQVMQAWGFEYKTNFVWVKNRSAGIGWFTENRHELLLIGIRGKIGHPKVKPNSVIYAETTRHSAKPECFYDIIESMYQGSYLELFARNMRREWTSWGNEL
jgi:N6-adenosine-specific RNA methylase IME4